MLLSRDLFFYFIHNKAGIFCFRKVGHDFSFGSLMFENSSQDQAANNLINDYFTLSADNDFISTGKMI